MKIKIQKHTKVRRPESRYRIAIWDKNSHSETTYVGQPLVNDITRVPVWTKYNNDKAYSMQEQIEAIKEVDISSASLV